jgi:serine/threonine-protein kinase
MSQGVPPPLPSRPKAAAGAAGGTGAASGNTGAGAPGAAPGGTGADHTGAGVPGAAPGGTGTGHTGAGVPGAAPGGTGTGVRTGAGVRTGVTGAGVPVPGAGASGAQGAASPDGLPKRFGKYTLLRSLAKGGMAELFLALQKSVAGFEKLIVIKRILPSMNQDQAFIEMLLQEARTSATLSHPNIVQIFDVGQAEGLYFIAMEHVHGEDIRSVVRQMKTKSVPEFPLEHALAITLGMCAGLTYAHEKSDLDGTQLNIVHRDISPQNVVITFSGDVKIVDFGIAKSDSKLAGDTKSGKLKGKVPYMSPEQARGENIDARSDIFATGVMLFELTTGKRLFKGSSEFETLKLICEREYPRPTQIRPGYPPGLEHIVMKALTKDRTQRYQSARDMQSDLEEFVRNERIPVSNIALSQFMQSLFEDKLTSQKELLLQGKQLADIIEQQNPRDSTTDFSQPMVSSLAASHTVTDLPANKGKGGLVVGLLLAVILIAGGGGSVWFLKHKQQQQGGPVTAPLPPPAVKGTIEVVSNPPGASIWINGDLRPEVTPATLTQLPTGGGAIDVKLTHDGFESEKQSVTLTEAKPKGTIKVDLKKGSVVVTVTVLPAGLTPTLSLDGKKYGTLEADGIPSGDQHKLIVSAPGYQDYTTTFIGAPQEKKHFDVTLQKEVKVTGTAHTATAAGPTGSGKLNVGASGGWCNVSVDGVPRGATPVAGIELSAGPHRVTCTPGDGKPPQTATVVVPANDTARQKFSL